MNPISLAKHLQSEPMCLELLVEIRAPLAGQVIQVLGIGNSACHTPKTRVHVRAEALTNTDSKTSTSLPCVELHPFASVAYHKDEAK